MKIILKKTAGVAPILVAILYDGRAQIAWFVSGGGVVGAHFAFSFTDNKGVHEPIEIEAATRYLHTLLEPIKGFRFGWPIKPRYLP